MKLLVGLLLVSLPACTGYMYLDTAGNDTYIGTDPLRGEKPGNIWNPPKKGANRIPCGGKGNTAFMPTEAERLRVAAGAAVRVVGKLTKPEDDEYLENKSDNFYENTFVELSIKYGNRPNFQMTRGYTMNPIWAPVNSEDFQVIRNIPEKSDEEHGALNKNATIQVTYHVSPDIAFYQCVDIWVYDGNNLQADLDFPWGKGPDDEHVDFPGCVKPPCVGGIPTDEFRDANIAFIILGLLILLVIGLILYCHFSRSDPVATKKLNEEPLQGIQAPVIPETPQKPEEPKTATPPEKEDLSDKDKEERVGRLIFIDAQEESDPTQESSGNKSLDATGSQGRHFHFRYVEEDGDGDEGAEERQEEQA